MSGAERAERATPRRASTRDRRRWCLVIICLGGPHGGGRNIQPCMLVGACRLRPVRITITTTIILLPRDTSRTTAARFLATPYPAPRLSLRISHPPLSLSSTLTNLPNYLFPFYFSLSYTGTEIRGYRITLISVPRGLCFCMGNNGRAPRRSDICFWNTYESRPDEGQVPHALRIQCSHVTSDQLHMLQSQ